MNANPIPANQRVELLDVLRGVSILGMWAVNLTADVFWSGQFETASLNWPDRIALALVNLFANGKFITIFSFLFGLGFFVQMERIRAKQGAYVTIYLRRAFGLLCIGLLAQSLTIPAWILIDYAILGLPLLLFYERSPKTLIVAILVLFILPKSFGLITEYYEGKALVPVTEIANDTPVPVQIEQVDESAERESVMRQGGLLEVGKVMVSPVFKAFSDWRYYMENLGLVGLMILGLYVGRKGAVFNHETQLRMAKQVLPWLLGFGFAASLSWVAIVDFHWVDRDSRTGWLIQRVFAWPYGMSALGLGYVAAVTLLLEQQWWKKVLSPFAAVGRMALTNYLLTGLVTAFLSFQWGLGLYGEIMPASGVAIVLIVFTLQLLLSNFWLRRFCFGPVEWLWRSFTYGRLQRMRESKVSVESAGSE